MKSRDEFLGSVYAKRDAVLARRKIYKKRVYTAVTAMAACMVLMVGAGGMGLLDSGFNLMAGAGSDAASNESVEDGFAAVDGFDGNESGNGAFVYGKDSFDSMEDDGGSDGQETEKNRLDEESSEASSMDGLVGSDGVAPGEGANGKPGETANSAGDLTGDGDSNYFCLPVAVVVEDGDGIGVRYGGFQQIDQAVKWVYKLRDQGIAVPAEDLTQAEKTGYVYMVTLVRSMEEDPDSQGADQIFYIFREVEYFE